MLYICAGSFIPELKAFLQIQVNSHNTLVRQKLLLVASTNILDVTAEILFLYILYFSVVFHLIGK